MSATATLTNCYIPLPAPSVPDEGVTTTAYDPNARPTGDSSTSETRGPKSLRRIHLSRSVLAASSGSSLLEIGQTKILCAVHGPRPSSSSSLSGGRAEFHAGGVLNCELRFAPHVGVRAETALSESALPLDSNAGGGVRGGGAVSPEEIEMSSRLRDALLPSVPLERLTKCAVDVFVMVLQGDGSVLAGAVTAASLALADAGVELYDLVCGCTVAVRGGEEDGDGGDSDKKGNLRRPCHLADPTEDETLRSSGVVTIAMMPNWKEVTFWDQVGRLTSDSSNEAVDLATDGCLTMHKFVRTCLVSPPSNGVIS